MNPSILSIFFHLKNQTELFHWQTYSHAEHSAFGDLYETLENLVDTFMESYMGCYGRPTIFKSIKLANYGERDCIEYYSSIIALINQCQENLPQTELNNILDEIKAAINKTKYLLTMSK